MGDIWIRNLRKILMNPYHKIPNPNLSYSLNTLKTAQYHNIVKIISMRANGEDNEE